MTDTTAPTPRTSYRKLTARIAHLAAQPSTWRGGIMFLTGIGIILDPTLAAHISAIGMAVAGLVGLLVDDDRNAD